jgi:DNA-binding PadR family transcriptional regulator
MRKNWFHVLAALAGQERHGSGIARDVLDQTDGELKLWPATLYRTLDEMAAERLIEELSGSEHPERESGRRKYYRITASGRLSLSAEAERLSALAVLARGRLRGDPR